MNGWPFPPPPGDATWDTEWPTWFDRWVGRHQNDLLAQARKQLWTLGVRWVPTEPLRDAAQTAIAKVGNRVRIKGVSWFHEAFVSELPFLAYIAKAIARDYIRQGEAEQAYRDRVAPVSPLPPSDRQSEGEKAHFLLLAGLEDRHARRALEGAEVWIDYLDRQSKPIRIVLRAWWSGETPEEIAARLGRYGARPHPHEVFMRILRLYRADTAEVIEAAIAASGDPCDPCRDRAAARTYIRTWILARKKFRVTPGGGGYSAEELAELVASRAATPLGEDPEPFRAIAQRLGRTGAAVERQYQRLCCNERHAWIGRITLNRHPGNPADPREDEARR